MGPRALYFTTCRVPWATAMIQPLGRPWSSTSPRPENRTGTGRGHTSIAGAELSPRVCQPSMIKFRPSNPRPNISFQSFWWGEKKKKKKKEKIPKSKQTHSGCGLLLRKRFPFHSDCVFQWQKKRQGLEKWENLLWGKSYARMKMQNEKKWEPGGNAREGLEPSPMQWVCLVLRPVPGNLH